MNDMLHGPVKEQITKLAMEDSTIRAAMNTTMANGGTFEDAMMLAVIMLHKRCEQLEEQLIKFAESFPTSNVFARGK